MAVALVVVVLGSAVGLLGHVGRAPGASTPAASDGTNAVERSAEPAGGAASPTTVRGHVGPAVSAGEWVDGAANPSVAPPPRERAAFAYDPAIGGDLLFGGNTTGGAFYSDTWAFENATWIDLTPNLTTSPPALAGSSMAYDPELDGVLLFGGVGPAATGGQYSAATWTFANGKWTDLTSMLTVSPPALAFAGMAYDVAAGEAILAGGTTAPTISTNATWAFSGGAWTNLTKTAHAPANLAGGGSMTYDPTIDAIVAVYPPGGATVSGADAAIKFASGRWMPVVGGSSPDVRSFATFTYDNASSSDVLFGGRATSGTVSNETWSFSNATGWTNESATALHAPPALDGASATFDPNEHAIVLFGGFAYHLDVDERATWFLTEEVTPSISISSDRTFAAILVPIHFLATITGNATAPYQFAWSFGDGTTAVGIAPTHAYGIVGNYTVTATVTDISGHVGTSPGLFEETFQKPSAVTELENLTETEVGTPVSFTASARGGTPPYTYAWTFGDGGSGSGSPVNHTFASAGKFSVTVIGTDILGGTIRNEIPEVVAARLACGINALSLVGEVGTALPLGAAPTGGVPPMTDAWTFGDGSGAGGAGIDPIYSVPGNYTVTVTTTDALALQCSTSVVVSIRGPETAVATTNEKTVDVGVPVQFTSTVTSGEAPYTYLWTFSSPTGTSSSDAANPIHTFSIAGSYRVSLTAYDSADGTSTSVITVVVNSLPSVHLVARNELSTTGVVVNFSATTSGGTGAIALTWSFGDGGSGTGPAVSHSYATPGSYHVAVVGTDADAVNTSDSVTVIIQAPGSPGIPSSSGGPSPLLVLGSGAAVVVAAGIGILLWRRRAGGRGAASEAPDEGATNAPPVGEDPR